VPQEWRFVGELQSTNGIALFPDFEDNFYYVIHVTLGVDAARNSKTNQVHFRGRAEHEPANFHGANSAFKIKFHGQRYTRELFERDVRQEGTGIQINGVSTRRLHDWDALVGNVIAKISRRGNPVLQVILLKRLLKTNRNCLEIAPRQSAVGGIALGKNEQVFFLLREKVVVGAEKSTDVGHAILFRRHGAAIAVAEHFLGDLLGSFGFKARLAQLDEIGVFGEAAGVEVERYSVLAANRVDVANVLH
jgi:hypothetical protein